MNFITDWFKQHFSNPQIVFLVLVMAVLFAIILLFGDILAPLLSAIVIAYVLEGLVRRMETIGIQRVLAATIVFILFVIALLAIMVWLLPLLTRQITQLVQQAPQILSSGQAVLMSLPENYPDLISQEQIQNMINLIGSELTVYGQNLLSFSLSSFKNVVLILLFMVLLPILVFFFLKDKDLIIDWIGNFLPRERDLTRQVWSESNSQFSNYIRGKFLEIIIVTVITGLVFGYLELQYAALLAVVVGLSVLVPFVGAALVTIPVLLIAWFQWGWSPELGYVALAYGVIQGLDGNLLVPLLFSEVVNLHPVAIITAVLFFGGLWGVGGVFFAIPLANLIQAIIRSWPSLAERI